MNSADDHEEDEDEDEELWAHVTRDVAPLHRRDRKGGRQGALPLKPRRKQDMPPSSGPVARGDKAAQPALQPPGIDRRTDEKLRRGRMDIDARIDLHGMGQTEAYASLRGFLLAGYGQGLRCVLVITGKGREGRGVLREKMPEWLREGDMGGVVLRFYPAKPQHGGQGAWYVLLRRRRD